MVTGLELNHLAQAILRAVAGAGAGAWVEADEHHGILLLVRQEWKKPSFLFKDALNTFYLRLYRYG